jgi:hypothetical protein
MRKEGLLLGLPAHFLQDAPKLQGDLLLPKAAEAVVLDPGEDGGGHPLGLGGGEDEEDVGRGFLQGLQEGVEGAFGEHVGLVQDEDLFGGGKGGQKDPLPQLPHVLHGVVAGGVNLHHVGVGALLHRLAVGADPARALLPLAPHGHGQEAGGGGFAHPTGAGEEVGLGQAPLPYGPQEGLLHVLLAHHLLEGEGAKSPVEGAHRG